MTSHTPTRSPTDTPARRVRLRHVALGYVAAVLTSTLTAAAALAAGADDDGLVVLLAGQAGFWAVLVASVLLVRRAAPATDVAVRVTGRDLAVGVPAGIVAQVVVLPLLYLPIQWLAGDLDVEGAARDLLDRGGGAGLAVLAIALVVVAPVVEELFFRGLLLGALRARMRDRYAVVVSAVIFGATHFQPLQFPGLAAAGLLFAALTVRTGRLGAAIAAHAAFNAVTVAFLLSS